MSDTPEEHYGDNTVADTVPPMVLPSLSEPFLKAMKEDEEVFIETWRHGKCVESHSGNITEKDAAFGFGGSNRDWLRVWVYCGDDETTRFFWVTPESVFEDGGKTIITTIGDETYKLKVR